MKSLRERIAERRREIALIFGFMVVYMLCFTWLENRTGVPIHMLEIRADDYIPFCEYFIVPYFLWFGYIAATVLYFTLYQDNKNEWYRLILSLGFGMTLFIVVSFLFPNGHTLREYSFERENIFTQMVRVLYKMDTSTNVMPSIHVFNSVACCVALMDSESLKGRQVIRWGSFVLTVLIVASTMFLKQHTIMDVIVALFLNRICWSALYNYRTVPVSWSFEK
ncbi:MAG: phosphatase PAP2 family protein [Candidatus Limivivens sp.]|nr:phosphatase PAP2 family protein [Candidatus Limivivens sp.]